MKTSAYRTRTIDALIPFEVVGTAGRQFFRNAGSVVTSGAEIAAAAKLSGAADVTVSYATVDARFDEYVVAGKNYAGLRVPGVARTAFSASGTWRTPRDIGLSAGVTHTGRTMVNDANTASSPGYWLADASLAVPPLRIAGATLNGVLGVRNLANAQYNTAVTVNAVGARYFEPGPARALFVSVTAGFVPR